MADQQAVVTRLAGMAAEIKPDTILTFGPDGMTGHPDHCTVSVWAGEAVKTAGLTPAIYHAVELEENRELLKRADRRFNIHFNIDEPKLLPRTQCDICFSLSPDLVVIKRQALAAQVSQTEAILDYLDDELFAQMFGHEAFVLAD